MKTTKPAISRKRLKRCLDPTIRWHERVYRRSVAERNFPDLAAFEVVKVLQTIRKSLVGKPLRGFSPTGRLPL